MYGSKHLGSTFNLSVGAVPADAVAGAITGNRVSLEKCKRVGFIVIAAAGSTDILDLDLQQHTAASGGTSADLDIIDHVFYQSEATLDGDEAWSRTAQAAASEVTNIGAASEQQLVYLEVGAENLTDGYTHVSLNVPDAGANGTKYVAIVNVLLDLNVQRKPEELPAASSTPSRPARSPSTGACSPRTALTSTPSRQRQSWPSCRPSTTPAARRPLAA
jgi:hypothetical protein